MSVRLKIINGSLVTACLVAVGSPPAAAARMVQSPPARDTPAAMVATPSVTTDQAAVASTVTLITGDKVTVSAGGKATIQPGDDRPGVSYLTRQTGGHLHVVPSDAQPLLQSGQLDPRLFDVTTLMESGYGDKELRLIVTTPPAGIPTPDGDPMGSTATDVPMVTPMAMARNRVGAAGASVTMEYPSLSAVAAYRPQGRERQLWDGLTETTAAGRSLRLGLGKVWLDAVYRPALDVSVPRIGSPRVWQAGYTGKGVTVAVLDTGIDATHPDLAGKVLDHRNFTEGAEDDRDLLGHGTHVASTIAGTGAASNGKYTGVAPDSSLLDAKVCVQQSCNESHIVAGMQWAVTEKHAKIVNISLGATDTPDVDLMESAINTLTATYGTLFVAAAGNVGQGGASVSSPSTADAALAVGAVDDTDALSSNSKRGPRAGDGAIKPDITAPGVDITAARGKDATDLPAGSPGDPYVAISGTSMAAPHVSGAAALLAQARPDASPAELKAALMATARPNPAFSVFDQGAGRVDVERAVANHVGVEPASLSLGTQPWPHADDEILTKTVTYHNGGASPLILALTASATAPDGTTAPPGMFTLVPTTVAIPAGADASVTLIANTRISSANGPITGEITATGGGIPLTTPFAVHKEPERFEVKIKHLDRSGTPTDQYSTEIYNLDSEARYSVSGGTNCGKTKGGSSTGSAWLPPGRYVVQSTICGYEAESDSMTTKSLLVEPGLIVTAPVAVTIDARAAQPLAITAPGARPDPETTWVRMNTRRWAVEFVFPNAYLPSTRLFIGKVSEGVGPGFSAALYGTWLEQPPAAPQPNWVPSAYHLAWRATYGRMVSGLTRTLTPRDLATVQAEHASTEGSRKQALMKEAHPSWFDIRFSMGFLPTASVQWLPLPSRRTEYFNTDDDVIWEVDATERATGSVALGQPTKYWAGRTTIERWNRVAFGPALAPPRPWQPAFSAASRTGNVISAAIGMFGDGDGRTGEARSTGSTTLSRYGTEIGTTNLPGSGDFVVPPGQGTYRLSTKATNWVSEGVPRDLSPVVIADWTFQSASTGTVAIPLPLWTVRFSPELDLTNTAPAGKALTLDLAVTAQPGAIVGKPRSVSVEISYDDGAIWIPVPLLLGKDGTARAVVPTPASSGYASLQAHVVDSAGNGVDLTISHAFRIGVSR